MKKWFLFIALFFGTVPGVYSQRIFRFFNADGAIADSLRADALTWLGPDLLLADSGDYQNIIKWPSKIGIASQVRLISHADGYCYVQQKNGSHVLLNRHGTAYPLFGISRVSYRAGLAICTVNGRQHIVNLQTGYLWGNSYAEVKTGYAGIVAVKVPQGWQYFNALSGKLLVDTAYTAAQPFQPGWHYAIAKAGKAWQLIDTTGRKVISGADSIILNADYEQTMLVKTGKYWRQYRVPYGIDSLMHIDSLATPHSFLLQGVVWKAAKGLFMVGYNGRQAAGQHWDRIMDNGSGELICRKGNYYLVTNTAGDTMAPPNTGFSNLTEAESGFYLAEYYGRYGYVDGKLIKRIPLRYENVAAFNEDVATVKSAGRWFHVSRADRFITQPLYDTVTVFCKGSTIVTLGRKKGLFNSNGVMALNTVYDDIVPVQGLGFKLLNNGKWGFANAAGVVVFDCAYTTVKIMANNVIFAQLGNKWGVFNFKAGVILPVSYYAVTYNPQLNILVAEAVQ